ncbi:30S ribosomal protein S16 [Candidatus Giovannonibacteria bacterium]|nr:30S ribosomal protein S16 [Candidatus Giovannonibacteria bacterium]
MLMIRLQRVGRRNDPSFRIVITDSRNAPRSGKFIEVVGAYDSKNKKQQFNLERIKYWISKGAKTSATVNNLLIKNKIISGTKIHVSINQNSAVKLAEAVTKSAAKADAIEA